MKKVGFDIHGVIDKNPELFSQIIKEFRNRGFEVHILTGSLISEKLERQLESYDIQYDNLFSILGYHKDNNTKMWEDERGLWIDTDLWNMTKANYCHRIGMTFHIDDTRVYGKYFKDGLFGHITPIVSKPRILELPKNIDTEVLEVFKKFEGYYRIQLDV